MPNTTAWKGRTGPRARMCARLGAPSIPTATRTCPWRRLAPTSLRCHERMPPVHERDWQWALLESPRCPWCPGTALISVDRDQPSSPSMLLALRHRRQIGIGPRQISPVLRQSQPCLMMLVVRGHALLPRIVDPTQILLGVACGVQAPLPHRRTGDVVPGRDLLVSHLGPRSPAPGPLGAGRLGLGRWSAASAGRRARRPSAASSSRRSVLRRTRSGAGRRSSRRRGAGQRSGPRAAW